MKSFATSIKADINKGIAILTGARAEIESGNQAWVCFAIDEATGPKRYDERIQKRLKAEIQHRLEGCTFVTGWLESKAGIKLSTMTSESVRAYRVRWIDSMIAELETLKATR